MGIGFAVAGLGGIGGDSTTLLLLSVKVSVVFSTEAVGAFFLGAEAGFFFLDLLLEVLDFRSVATTHTSSWSSTMVSSASLLFSRLLLKSRNLRLSWFFL